MRLLYLVHDLADPAVARRVTMMTRGGAFPLVAGFYRTPEPPKTVAGAPAHALGRTHDARLLQRAIMVGWRRLAAGHFAHFAGSPQVIVARNLEMLSLAAPLARSLSVQRLAYEVLDIHRLALGDGATGRLLRHLEKRLCRSANVTITSSPAFLRHYFERRSGVETPFHVVENKVLAERHQRPDLPRPAGPPWRIGLLGAIRCRRSVDTLRALAARADGAIEVVLRGRPTPAVFGDLAAELANAPHITFEGPYSPHHLADVYRDLHFVWAIDHYEAGANSEWLIPNRLYEGLFHGAVPIARPHTETAATLASLGAGLILDEGEVKALAAMSPSRYQQLANAVRAVPAARLCADKAACEALVALLAGRPDAHAKQVAA